MIIEFCSTFWGQIGDSVDDALPLRRWCRLHAEPTMLPEATMASLEFRSNRYRIVDRVSGKKLFCSLKTSDFREANGCLARLEEDLRLLHRGRLIPSPNADLSTFLLPDGQVAESSN